MRPWWQHDVVKRLQKMMFCLFFKGIVSHFIIAEATDAQMLTLFSISRWKVNLKVLFQRMFLIVFITEH